MHKGCASTGLQEREAQHTPIHCAHYEWLARCCERCTVAHAGAIATSAGGDHTAVLEHTGTSVVIFREQSWQQPVAAVALSLIADGPLSERFVPCLAWDPDGTILAMLTTEGHVVVVSGANDPTSLVGTWMRSCRCPPSRCIFCQMSSQLEAYN